MIEERAQDLLAEVEPGVAVKVERAERAAVADLLTVVPRAEDQKDLVVRRVLRRDRLVDGGGAVDVFLVPQAVDEHHRRLQRLLRQQLVHRLVAPEVVVAGVLDDLLPEAYLIEPPAAVVPDPVNLFQDSGLRPHRTLTIGVAASSPRDAMALLRWSIADGRRLVR